MFDYRNYYKKENDKEYSSYKETLIRIKKINIESKELKDSNKYYKYFNFASKWLLKISEFEKKLNNKYFSENNIETLKNENLSFYNELLGNNYLESYANPDFTEKLFNEEFGKLISFSHFIQRQAIINAYTHKIFINAEINKIFIEFYDYINNNNNIEFDDINKILTKIKTKDQTELIRLLINEKFNPDITYNMEIIKNSDLSDLRYLYRYGKYISENEIKTAKFFQNYSKEKIKRLAKQIVKAYILGFELNNKDIKTKESVTLSFSAGFEILVKEIIYELENKNLKPVLSDIISTKPNRQYIYDYRFDNGLYLSQDYVDMIIDSSKNALESQKNILLKYSGIILLNKFGENPFKPENKKNSIKQTNEQQKLYQYLNSKSTELTLKYIPRSETSFTIIAFPSPEIGNKFENIFEDILEINMEDSDKYFKIQKNIIDILDKGKYAHIKGKGDNKTDIKVKFQKIENPENETNFTNCGADVNIPVGEVFTSPQLKGTNGILHIKEAFLKSLRFIDLIIEFKDGYIEKYSCKNFPDEKENKKYIEENLLYPHKTLPMGEFAIGTNTLAYVISRKYNIINLLPVLIVEKMGPHFAIGDTCFMFVEDRKVYNPIDNKEITAKDNEKTILRKIDFQKAYTNIHIDITLPYEDIDFIASVDSKGIYYNIIKDGKFVLNGTEYLNEAFKRNY